MSDFELTARITPEPLPSTEATTRYLRVCIVDAAGNHITEIPRRKGVSCSEPLNTPGTGQLTISRNDPILQAYRDQNIDILKFGNIVQFWLGSKCVSGIRIKQKAVRFVGSAEALDLAIQVSGPTVHHMLDDFIVRHDGIPRPTSDNTRSYSWASRPGEWYNEADWDHPVRQWTLKNPPTPEKRKNPKKWRVPSAKWISFRGGWKYFRETLVIADPHLYRFYASADEWFKLYINGEEILSDRHREIGYKSYVECDQYLEPGRYTIGVQVRARKSGRGDGWDLFLFGVCKVNKKNRRILPPVLVSNDRWKAHKGNPPPGWNRAQVLRSMIAEAKARGVHAALNLTVGFGEAADTGGKPWTDRFNEEVDVGGPVLEAQAKLSEGDNFDVWIDPATLTVKAWNFRGKNRSASIALMPGVNLMDYETTETDEVKNSVLIQYEKGWTETRLASSQQYYGTRETYAELGNIKNDETALRIMNQVLRGIGRSNKESGTGDIKNTPEDVPTGSIIPVEGMFPMVDYETGDIISALNADADMVPHRVMNLTLTEDDQGQLSFDGEFEEVDRIV